MRGSPVVAAAGAGGSTSSTRDRHSSPAQHSRTLLGAQQHGTSWSKRINRSTVLLQVRTYKNGSVPLGSPFQSLFPIPIQSHYATALPSSTLWQQLSAARHARLMKARQCVQTSGWRSGDGPDLHAAAQHWTRACITQVYLTTQTIGTAYDIIHDVLITVQVHYVRIAQETTRSARSSDLACLDSAGGGGATSVPHARPLHASETW